jgi:hypothetical protein
MDEEPKRRPIFWPVLFMSAFVLGAVLWAVWMSRVIQQTREKRDPGFFVPMNTNPLPIVQPGQASSTTNSVPPADTNR